ncbi:MAG: lysylphosphatidylglycerol synthase transmembrane domain-containing protein [Longimicrobiales bacterium]
MREVVDGDGSSAHATRRAFLDWKALAGIALSVVLLYFTFRDVDFREVLREIGQADPWLLLGGAAAATFVFWIRAWRWRSILAPVHRGTSFHSRFAAVNIGFMANNLLPARMGEFARAYAISRLEPVPVVAGLSSLVIERLLDALFLVFMLFFAMALPDFPGWPDDATTDFPTIARGLGLVAGCAGLVLFLLVLFPRPAVRAIEAVVNHVLPRSFRRPIVDALEAFLSGAAILRNGRLLAVAVAWTVVVWLVNAFGFWLGFRAFDLDLTFTAALFFNSAIAFAVAAPSAPGFFGVYELAARAVLVNLWGREASKAVGFALGFHIAGFIPVTIMGLYYAWSIGLTLGGVAQTEEVVEDAVERETGASRSFT